jgi:hypothetical protein
MPHSSWIAGVQKFKLEAAGLGINFQWRGQLPVGRVPVPFGLFTFVDNLKLLCKLH